MQFRTVEQLIRETIEDVERNERLQRASEAIDIDVSSPLWEVGFECNYEKKDND